MMMQVPQWMKQYRSQAIALVIAAFVVGIVLFVLLFGLFRGFEGDIRAAIHDQFADTQLSQTAELANLLSQEIRETVQVLETLVTVDAVLTGESDPCTEYLQRIKPTIPVPVGAISRVDETLTFDCSTIEGTIGQDARRFSYIEQLFTMDEPMPVISPAVTGTREDGSPVVFSSIHVPRFSESGAFLGSLGAALFLDDVVAAFDSSGFLPDGTNFYIADSSQELLFASDPLPDIEGTLVDMIECTGVAVAHGSTDRSHGTDQHCDIVDTNGHVYIVTESSIPLPSGSAWTALFLTPIDGIDPFVSPLVRQARSNFIAIISTAFALLGVVTGGILFWNSSLRRRVQRQTKAVHAANDQLQESVDTLEVREEELQVALTQKEKEEERERALVEKLERTKRAMLNVMEDIRDEKIATEEARERLELATSAGGFGLWDWDLQRDVMTWDEQMCQLHNIAYSDAIEDFRQTGNDLLVDEDRDQVITAFEHTIKTGDPLDIVHRVNIGKGNGERYLHTVGVLKRDSDGSPLRLVGFAWDVTEAQQIDKAKSEFVSLASHQLRTPLTAINWYAELLMSGDAGKLNKEQKEYVDEIYRGNQRMVALVNALLNVSRIDLGTFRVSPVKTDVPSLLLDTLSQVALQVKQKKLQVTTKIAKKIPDILVDPKLLGIVIENLLTNAIKYTPEQGSITVSLKVGATAQTGKKKMLLLSVADTGLGVPASQQKKIFTKLFRADNVLQTDTQGTGLGLYIVKSIIEETGGRIWFTSKEGKGSTFTIALPMQGMSSRKGSKQLSQVG